MQIKNFKNVSFFQFVWYLLLRFLHSLPKGKNYECHNAELEFRNENGESFKIKTDINGKYHERIHPDVYSIYVTHPDFQAFLIEGQKILPGEMRVENFELRPRV